jgi:hypothetical protein
MTDESLKFQRMKALKEVSWGGDFGRLSFADAISLLAIRIVELERQVKTLKARDANGQS